MEKTGFKIKKIKYLDFMMNMNCMNYVKQWNEIKKGLLKWKKLLGRISVI